MDAVRRLLALFTGGLMLASVVGLFIARAKKERIEEVDAPDADEIRLAAIFEPISEAPRHVSAVARWTAGTGASSSTFARPFLIRAGHGSMYEPSSGAPRSWFPPPGESARRSSGSAAWGRSPTGGVRG